MATEFIRAANPIWYMVDLTGLSLNDEYYAFFLSNTFPYVPQPVYRYYQNTSATWPYILQFQPGGTLPNNLYFDPDLVYRIEIRQGNTQSDPLIYEINNFVPGNGGGEVITNIFQNSENQITNPQFSEISFVSPLTYTASTGGEHRIDIAPGWELVVTGMGTTVLTQLELPGNTQAGIENPPYALNINNTGWTEASLVQRFHRNGAIFAGGAIAASITARAYSVSQQLSVVYEPSDAMNAVIVIDSETVPIDAFVVLNMAANINASTSADEGDAAYVDIIIQLNPAQKIDITNVQIIGQSTQIVDIDTFNSDELSPVFFEETIEREIDNTFHNYRDDLIYKPIPSYLTGWDFLLNPCQELGVTPGTIAIGPSSYIADQTILFQSSTSGISVALTNTGLQLSVVSGSVSCALIQYLDYESAYQLLNNPCCSQLQALVSSGTLKGTISLWWTADADLPDITATTYQSLVSSIATGGIPTCSNGTWNQVPRPNLASDFAPFTLGVAFDNYDALGFDATSVNTSTVTYMAIVVCFDSYAATNSITVNYCSLMNGNIATKPAPQSIDDVLRECQYYYEMSYISPSTPGTATSVGELLFPQIAVYSSPFTLVFPTVFQQTFKTIKRDIPVLTYYSQNASTVNRALVTVYDGGTLANTPSVITFLDSTTFKVIVNASQYNVSYSAAGTSYIATFSYTPSSTLNAYLTFQYVADARFGVV